jgi:hypothetical protein
MCVEVEAVSIRVHLAISGGEIAAYKCVFRLVVSIKMLVGPEILSIVTHLELTIIRVVNFIWSSFLVTSRIVLINKSDKELGLAELIQQFCFICTLFFVELCCFVKMARDSDTQYLINVKALNSSYNINELLRV